jgi:hypothetical protein
MATPKNYFSDFKGYCRTLADKQLENVLRIEHEAGETDRDRRDCFHAAVCEAERRGWTVDENGKRLD